MKVQIVSTRPEKPKNAWYAHIRIKEPADATDTLKAKYPALLEKLQEMAIACGSLAHHLRRDRPPVAVTVCRVTDPISGSPSVTGFGLAFCSAKDNFCRETGRMLAYSRAVNHALRQLRIPALFAECFPNFLASGATKRDKSGASPRGDPKERE